MTHGTGRHDAIGLNPTGTRDVDEDLLAIYGTLDFSELEATQRARQLGFRAYHVLRSANLDLWRRPQGQFVR